MQQILALPAVHDALSPPIELQHAETRWCGAFRTACVPSGRGIVYADSGSLDEAREVQVGIEICGYGGLPALRGLRVDVGEEGGLLEEFGSFGGRFLCAR